jgi:CheY-like chemotaxis protein
MTRVLVVEDHPLSRELLCDWLEGEGYEVQSAENDRSCPSHRAEAFLSCGLQRSYF